MNPLTLRTSCDRCSTEHWSVIGTCLTCEKRCCNECAEVVNFNDLVCNACMRDIAKVFEQIKPEYFEAIGELVELRDGSIPDQPVSLDAFRSILKCKNVSEVRSVFLRFMGPGATAHDVEAIRTGDDRPRQKRRAA